MSGNAPVPQPGVPYPGRAEREAQHPVPLPPSPTPDATQVAAAVPPAPVRSSYTAVVSAQSAVPPPPAHQAPPASFYQTPPSAQPVYRTPPPAQPAYPGQRVYASQPYAASPGQPAYQPAQPAPGQPAYQPAHPPAQRQAYPQYAEPSVPGYAPAQSAASAQPPAQPTNPARSGGAAPASPTAPRAPGGPGREAPPPERQRLGWGWIAFIAADAALVIGAVVLGVSLFGGGGSPSTPQAEPPTTTSASPSEDAAAPAPGTESFASPSGNISCDMSPQGVSCTIAALAQTPAPVDGCSGTVGYRVVLGAGGVDTPCVPTNEQPRAAGSGVPVLDYGQTKTVGPYTCNSSESGVTCRDESGEGFTLAKAGIQKL